MVKHWLMLDPGADDIRSPYRARLASLGRHLPATHLLTEDLMASTRHSTHIDLERLTGIHERRVSVGEEDSYSLAITAAQDCLSRSPHPASSIEVVRLRPGSTVLVVAVGAGVTAGAALYRVPGGET